MAGVASNAALLFLFRRTIGFTVFRGLVPGLKTALRFALFAMNNDTITEKELRELRDKVFGWPMSEPGWAICKQNWAKPESVQWLKDKSGGRDPSPPAVSLLDRVKIALTCANRNA